MECIIVLVVIGILIYMLFEKSKENYQNYSVTGEPGSQHIEFCQTQCQSNRPFLVWWWENWANKNRDTAANCILDCQNIMKNDPNQMVYLPTNANVYQNYGFTKSSP